jgi:hypothetical protein
MSFPTTSILDDFNRTAEGPPPSANWTLVFGVGSKTDGTCLVRGSTGSGNDNGSYWNVETFGPDTEVFATVTTKTGFCDLLVRLANVPGATTDGYSVAINSSTNLVRHFRIDNAVFTLLGANESQTITNGDSWGYKMIGSTMQAYYKVGAGPWLAIGSGRSDSTYSAAGYIGLTMESSSAQYDNFGGGSIVTTQPTLYGTTSPLRW